MKSCGPGNHDEAYTWHVHGYCDIVCRRCGMRWIGRPAPGREDEIPGMQSKARDEEAALRRRASMPYAHWGAERELAVRRKQYQHRDRVSEVVE